MKRQQKRTPAQGNILMDKISGVYMNICGNKEVIFEGSRGIVEYNENSIKINTGKYIVAFSGRGLHIRCMNEFSLVIAGFITSIEYIM